MAIIVVYNRNIELIKPWKILRNHLLNENHLNHIILYDNSPKPLAKPTEDIKNVTYINNKLNGGTVSAYKYALERASELEIDWLLLLDHDTEIDDNFINHSMDNYINIKNGVAAFLPWVFHKKATISPAIVNFLGTIKPIIFGQYLDAKKHITAISSGAILHVPSVNKILPIPDGLWLDYFDHWLFAKLHSKGYTVIITDHSIQHDLSIMDLSLVNRDRYISILNGEREFIKSLGLLPRFIHPIRILGRITKISIINFNLSKETLKWLLAGYFK